MINQLSHGVMVKGVWELYSCSIDKHTGTGDESTSDMDFVYGKDKYADKMVIS